MSRSWIYGHERATILVVFTLLRSAALALLVRVRPNENGNRHRRECDCAACCWTRD